MSRAAPVVSAKWPSASVLACASCAGAPALAAHKVTVEFATGAPAVSTRPLTLSAAQAWLAKHRLAAASAANAIFAALLCPSSSLCVPAIDRLVRFAFAA